MKIAPIDNTQCDKHSNIAKKNSPNFKSSIVTNMLGASGALMQGIENKGYLLSFLIQDGLGMTLPRTITGFHRDKEVTGEYNIKEGLEVLGREGLTGPFMMAIAPAMLWIANRTCASAGTNTRLLKIIGNNFKSMLESANFNSGLKNDKKAFKQEFIKYNLEKFYKDTIPEDKEYSETINYILNEFGDLNSKTSKVSKNAYNNILNKINDNMIRKSKNLENICKLTADLNGKKQVFAAGDVIKAINHFANDAIERNSQFNEIDSNAAENIKNNFAAKRLGFNVATVTTTLAGLSILPKLYAFNSVAPGAQHLVKDDNDNKDENKSQQNSVSFKGKGINSENWISKLGKFITKKIPAWFQKEFEYSGYNFTPSLMACLSMFGLLLPRGLRAYDRALVDENGKKDMTEINEILLRDSISSLGVVYTVPIMQKGIISLYENKQGFILSNRASMNKSKWNKFIDAINPYSDLKLFTNTELQALYGNIDSKEKMVNFAKFINEKGGDLEKILSKSTNAQEIFNNNTFTLESIKNKDKADKNSKLISFFEKMKDNQETKEKITKLMHDAPIDKKGSIEKIARGLNSVPGFISTVFISPIILGWFIPRLTYSNTRKKHAKMEQNGSKFNKENA